MDLESQDFLFLVLKAAVSWTALGFAAGALLGLVLYAGLGWFGLWRLPAKRSRVWRWLMGAWFVLGTALGACLVVGAVGAYQGMYAAIRSAPTSAAMIDEVQRVSLDVGLACIVQVGASNMVSPASGSPVSADVAAAVRAGTGEVPVADVRAAVEGFGRAVAGNNPQEVMAVVQACAAASPPANRQHIESTLIGMVDGIRAGRQLITIEPALLTAWRAVDAVAATTGDPKALSRDEIHTLVIDKVLLPRLLRSLVVVLAPWALTGIGLLPGAWLPPVVLAWLFRRRETSKDDASVEGVHAIR